VAIGDKMALVGVRIVSWELPPEWHQAYVEAIVKQLEAAAKSARDQQAANTRNGASADKPGARRAKTETSSAGSGKGDVSSRKSNSPDP
jgi:hypothetical protein